MKKLLVGLPVIVALGGCSNNTFNVVQLTKELEAGQKYDINTLISAEEGVLSEIVNDTIIIDELGTYEVEFKLVKDGKEDVKTYEYKVIDSTAPTIIQTKPFNIIQGAKFKLSDYITIEDNVNEDLIDKAVTSEIDSSRLGEQTFTVTVSDASGNETTEEYVLNVIEPQTVLSIGEIQVSKWGGNEVEFTLNEVGFQEEVYSYSDNMFASYYPDVEGEQYFVVKMTLKNLGGNAIDQNAIGDIVVTFDDKYTYYLQQMDTTSSVLSQYWGLEPLRTLDVFFLNTIPEELINSTYKVCFKVGTTEYVIEK